MSSPLPSRLLRSAEQAALPAGLAGVLLAVLLLELLLPATTPLPTVMLPPLRAGTGGVGSAVTAAVPVPPRPVILATPIFAPRGGNGSSGGGAAGFSLAGTALSRGTALAIVRTSTGTQLLRPGQSIDGYRLLAVARNGAMFAGKDGRHGLRVGASVGAAPAAPPAAAAEESDQ